MTSQHYFDDYDDELFVNVEDGNSSIIADGHDVIVEKMESPANEVAENTENWFDDNEQIFLSVEMA